MKNFKTSLISWVVRLVPEFVVVVVGVVVGLGVDNARQEREQSKLKEEYIKSFINISVADTIMLHGELDRVKIKDSCARRLINVIKKKTQDSVDVYTLLNAASLLDPSSNFALFDDLMATGNINVFKDLDHKRRIINRYSYLKYNREWLRDMRVKKNQDDIFPLVLLGPFAHNMQDVQNPNYKLYNIRLEIEGKQEMLPYLSESLLYCSQVEDLIKYTLLPTNRVLLSDFKKSQSDK